MTHGLSFLCRIILPFEPIQPSMATASVDPLQKASNFFQSFRCLFGIISLIFEFGKYKGHKKQKTC